MKPYTDSAFSDSSLRSLYKTNDILVSDCDEVSNHEIYNLIDKIDISNPALQFKRNFSINDDKETSLNSKNEKFKYKPRFLFNKYDEPGKNSENKITGDIEEMDRMSNRMKSVIDEMQLKKIISLTAVLKSNQTCNTRSNHSSKELVKNILDIELPKQINKIVASCSTVDKREKISTEFYSPKGISHNEQDNISQADDEMSETNLNKKFSKSHKDCVVPANNSMNQANQTTSISNVNFTKNIENQSTTQMRQSYKTQVTPIFPQKVHKIEKRIKNLEKLMKKLQIKVKSLQKRSRSIPKVTSNKIEAPGTTNKENYINNSKIKLYSSTTTNRTLGLASSCASKQMENPYDELFYESRQRNMNLLRYKKSERSILFNQYPILKWNKPILSFDSDAYKLPPRPRFIRD